VQNASLKLLSALVLCAVAAGWLAPAPGHAETPQQKEIARRKALEEAQRRAAAQAAAQAAAHAAHLKALAEARAREELLRRLHAEAEARHKAAVEQAQRQGQAAEVARLKTVHEAQQKARQEELARLSTTTRQAKSAVAVSALSKQASERTLHEARERERAMERAKELALTLSPARREVMEKQIEESERFAEKARADAEQRRAKLHALPPDHVPLKLAVAAYAQKPLELRYLTAPQRDILRAEADNHGKLEKVALAALLGRRLPDDSRAELRREIEKLAITNTEPEDALRLVALHAVLDQDHRIVRADHFVNAVTQLAGGEGAGDSAVSTENATFEGGGTVIWPHHLGMPAKIVANDTFLVPGFNALLRTYPVLVYPVDRKVVVKAADGIPSSDAVVVQVQPDAHVKAEVVKHLYFAGHEEAAKVVQTTRILRVANATDKKVSFRIRYEAPGPDGAPVWLPAKPADVITVKDVLPGHAMDLSRGDWPVNATRVRVWAEAVSGKVWDRFREEDLVLVPEVDAEGKHTYEAPAPDVLVFTVR
jgi:hypothetical protein